MPIKPPPPVEITPNSKVTPISQEPITSIDRTQWSKETTQSLTNQLEALKNRYHIMLRYGYTNVAQQLAKGIQDLEAMIESKQGTEE